MTSTDDRIRFASHLLAQWRLKYPEHGAVLVYGGHVCGEDALAPIGHATQPLMHGSPVLVYDFVRAAEGPRFDSPQRSYARADASTFPEDVAEVAVRDGWVGTGRNEEEAIRTVGAWRWPLMAKHRQVIVPLVQGRRTLDFGGLAGPVGYGADIVDHGADARALYDVPGTYDTIFTSHTLEHVVDIDLCLLSLNQKLRPGGHIVAHVPSSQNVGLRAGNWPHHHQTFCLRNQSTEPGWVALDEKLGAWGEVLLTDDDSRSLLVIARKAG